MKKRITLLALCLAAALLLTSCGRVGEWLLDLRRERSYTVTFDANGGEGEMEDRQIQNGSGSIPVCTFTKEGYECLAWSLDAEGTDFFRGVSNLTFLLPMSVKNGDTVRLYANWSTPGFEVEEETFAYFAHASLISYTGTAEEVVLPVWYHDRHIQNVAEGLFRDHTEITAVKRISFHDLSAEMFYGCTALRRVEIEQGNSIYRIGDRAFYGCASLEELELTGNLESIGNEAFYGCTGAIRLVIPAYLDELGADAFYGWTAEQTIVFTRYSENPFGEEPFRGCEATILWGAEE